MMNETGGFREAFMHMDQATFRSATPDQRTQGVSFDLYERYSIAAHLVRRFRQPGPCAVLDVGGHSSVLWPGFQSVASAFIPDASVFVVDVHRESGLRNYAVGSGLELPFPDCTFDFVLAQDTLEHIPATERERFITELIRVGRKAVLLSFPFFTPLNTSCDKLIYRFIQLRKHVDLPALSEHLVLGLPELATIREYINRTGYRFSTWTHGNTLIWLKMMLAKSHLWAQGIPELEEVLDSVFNAHFAVGDYGAPCYREFILISKDGSTEKVIDEVNRFRGKQLSADDRQAVYSLCESVLGSTSSVETERRSQHSINLAESFGSVITQAIQGQRQELLDREIRLAEKTSQAQHYHNLLEEQRQQLADASIRLAEATSRAAHYETLLDDSRQRTADLETRLAERTSQGEHYHNLIEEQRHQIGDLSNRLAEAANRISEYETSVQELRQRASDSERREEEQRNRIADLEGRLVRDGETAKRLLDQEKLSRTSAEKELTS
jgi:ubiquinone/menaquinone biosynthesis C-methylase UbiE